MKFDSWKEVAKALLTTPDDGCFFTIRVGDDRTGFMDRKQAMTYVQEKLKDECKSPTT